jgi:hypothetical protein
MQTSCQVYRLAIKLIFGVYRRGEVEKVTHPVTSITWIDIFVTKFYAVASPETDCPHQPITMPVRHPVKFLFHPKLHNHAPPIPTLAPFSPTRTHARCRHRAAAARHA